MVYSQIFKNSDELLAMIGGKTQELEISLIPNTAHIYKKIGIQSNPNLTQFILVDNNNASSTIRIGTTGIFELDLTNISMYGVKDIKWKVNPGVDTIPPFILIDLLREEGGN